MPYQTFQKGPKAELPKTLTDRVVRFLIEGLKREELPSKNRYRKFKGKNIDSSFYWVGKNGAVRAGRTVSDSVSITDAIHANMKLWERKEKKS